MPRATRAAIVAAAIAITTAGAVLAQSAVTRSASGATPADGRADERASAVIRAIENETEPSGGVAIDATELGRARAAGELQAAQRGAPIRIERIRIDDPVRSGKRAMGRGAAVGPVSDRAEPRLQRKAQIGWSGSGEQRDYRTAIENPDSAQ